MKRNTIEIIFLILFWPVVFGMIWLYVRYKPVNEVKTQTVTEQKRQAYGYNNDDICIEIQKKFPFDAECLRNFKIYAKSMDYNCYRRNWILLNIGDSNQMKRLWYEYLVKIHPWLAACSSVYFGVRDIEKYIEYTVTCAIKAEIRAGLTPSSPQELYDLLRSPIPSDRAYEENEKEIKKMEIDALSKQGGWSREMVTKTISEWKDKFIKTCSKDQSLASCNCLQSAILEHFPEDLLAQLAVYRTDIADYLEIVIGQNAFKQVFSSCKERF